MIALLFLTVVQFELIIQLHIIVLYSLPTYKTRPTSAIKDSI